jgi:hypothetical protein
MIGSQPRTHARIGTRPAPFAETITMMSNTRQHQDADFLLPEEIAETGAISPLYAWLADTMRSVWPQLVEMDIVTEEAIPAETLASGVKSAVVEARSQI